MSHVSIASKPGLLGAATALGTAALLSGPALAGAWPPVPLAPACDQFQFIGDYSLRQANGFTVQFRSTGPSASGSASALDSSGKTAMTGTVSGGIDRTRIDFTIRWGSGPRGHYTGLINADGFARGTTVDEANPGPITNWGATVPWGCATPEPTGPRPGPSNGPILAPTDTPPAPSATPRPTGPTRQP
ncbi:hypothetical protein MSEO_19460 [Mycobacterium seoulense]|uniref:Uncharacterized protein n=1 Tax=Mycobacterium seoulense TaxID=386911 RepID=A0A7I7NXP5_9MYCO|nr:hypothetical protein MSEO_19460 [Mycobacterium seoulense]